MENCKPTLDELVDVFYAAFDEAVCTECNPPKGKPQNEAIDDGLQAVADFVWEARQSESIDNYEARIKPDHEEVEDRG